MKFIIITSIFSLVYSSHLVNDDGNIKFTVSGKPHCISANAENESVLIASCDSNSDDQKFKFENGQIKIQDTNSCVGYTSSSYLVIVKSCDNVDTKFDLQENGTLVTSMRPKFCVFPQMLPPSGNGLLEINDGVFEKYLLRRKCTRSSFNKIKFGKLDHDESDQEQDDSVIESINIENPGTGTETELTQNATLNAPLPPLNNTSNDLDIPAGAPFRMLTNNKQPDFITDLDSEQETQPETNIDITDDTDYPESEIDEIDTEIKIQKSGQFCSGQQAPNWQPYLRSGSSLDIDISSCEFENKPLVFTSLLGDGSQYKYTGISAIYHLTTKDFRIYLRGLNYENGNERNYTVQWFAIGT